MFGVNRRQFIKSGVATAAATAVPSATRAAEFRPPSHAARGIKLACPTSPWTRYGTPLSDALAAIAAAGYDWAETTDDQVWNHRDSPGDIKKLLEAHSLGLITVVMSGNFADMNERLKNISRAVLLARVLRALDAGLLVLESTGWGHIAREPRSYHVFSSNLGEIGALVYEETGLHCAYRFKEDEAADVRKLVATSDSRYVKFCVDTQYLTRLGIEPARMVRAYGPRLIHVHLHDGRATGGIWHETPIGRGAVKLEDTLDALCDTHFNGWATIVHDQVHASPGRDASKSLERVRGLLRLADRRSREPASAAHHDHGAQSSAGDSRLPYRVRLQNLMMLGAAGTAQQLGFFRPAAFPSAGQTRASHAVTHTQHRNRPVAPLPPRDPYFTPLFFSPEEYRDVSALVEAIIPTTDTPGARAARADEYADLMIWLDQDDHRDAREQVRRFRQLCQQRAGRRFADLSPEQADDFLSAITGGAIPATDQPARAFLNRIRNLTVRAYYASPQGLIEELGYQGNTYVSEFKGCTHPEHRA